MNNKEILDLLLLSLKDVIGKKNSHLETYKVIINNNTDTDTILSYLYPDAIARTKNRLGQLSLGRHLLILENITANTLLLSGISDKELAELTEYIANRAPKVNDNLQGVFKKELYDNPWFLMLILMELLYVIM